MTGPMLTDWPRPRWVPGGKNPFLFYVVYGRIDTTQVLSPETHRSEGIPAGLNAMAYGPAVRPDVVASFRQGYAWDDLVADNASLAAQVAAQDSCLILKRQVTDPQTLNYLRDAIGFLTYCLDAGGIAIYDPQILKWWERSEWRSEIWDAGETALGRHVVILVSEDADGTEWIHTRGLRKFGRPDLSIHGVAPPHRDAVIDLCNRFIPLLASGEIPAEGQEVRMRSLPYPMRCVRRGSEEDPDFNNEHIEIVPASE